MISTLLTFTAFNLQHKFFKEEQILFRKGEFSNHFYLIYDGKVKILKTMKRREKMNAEEYYDYLLKLYNEKIYDLFEETRDNNSLVYPLSQDQDLFLMKELLFKLKLRNILIKGVSVYNLKMFLKEHFKSLEDLGFSTKKLQEFDLKNDQISITQIYSSIYSEIKNDPFLKPYSIIEDPLETKNVLLYENYIYKFKKKGEYFGELGFQNIQKLRTSTIQVEANTHLLFISADIYEKFIQKENLKLKKKEISNLLLNYFFQGIPKFLFLKEYYNNFFSTTPQRGEFLYKQGLKSESVSFILNGEVEITIKTSLEDLLNLINQIKVHIRCFLGSDAFKKQNEDLVIQNDDPEIKVQKIFKIIVACSNEVIGLDECFLGTNILFTSMIISDESRVLNLRVDEMKKVLSYSKKCNEIFEEYCLNKLQNTVNRLSKVFNNHSRLLDIKNKALTEKQKEFIFNRPSRPLFNFSLRSIENTMIQSGEINQENYFSCRSKETTINRETLKKNKSTLINLKSSKAFQQANFLMNTLKSNPIDIKDRVSQSSNNLLDNEINRLKKEISNFQVSRNKLITEFRLDEIEVNQKTKISRLVISDSCEKLEINKKKHLTLSINENGRISRANSAFREKKHLLKDQAAKYKIKTMKNCVIFQKNKKSIS